MQSLSEFFMRRYDHYATEIKSRAHQLAFEDATTTEAVRPVNLKIFVDSEWLESAVSLGFIDGADTVEDLTDELLRKYLEKKAEEKKELFTVSTLDAIIQKELTMDMYDKSAKSRMESLFTSYISILRRNGLSWITKTHQKTAVSHVLWAIKPKILQSRLESDLDFAYAHLRKDFREFVEHSFKLSEAYELLDNGHSRDRSRPARIIHDSQKSNGASGSGGNKTPVKIPRRSQLRTSARRGKHLHALFHTARRRIYFIGLMTAHSVMMNRSGR